MQREITQRFFIAFIELAFDVLFAFDCLFSFVFSIVDIVVVIAFAAIVSRLASYMPK